jgi:methionyl aminopeptidase
MIALPGLRNRKIVAQRSADELDAMAAAGSLVAAALLAVRQAAAAGVSTLTLDGIAESVIRDGGGTPSFLGYHGFPASICSSVNDRVVHGIPSAAEILAPGDLVSIDCGAIVDGWHGDSAVTFGVGPLIPVDEALCGATRAAMEAGIAAMVPGNRLTDVSHAIEAETHAAEARYDRKFGIVAGYGGHGIGRQMHMDPFLPNEGLPGRGPYLVPGSVLAIEPMLTLGTSKTVVLEDEWTVVTADGSRAAHWEHTVVVTDDGPRILTR